MKSDRKVKSLGELVQAIKELHKDDDLILWFRGHANKEWELIPSVQRLEKKESEQYLTNDFYMKASVTMKEKPSPDNYSGWIAIMQHFGLPTRLLDWSESLLISAFFATNGYEEFPGKDACIWILKPSVLNEFEGFGDYLYPMDTKTCLDMIYPAFKNFEHKNESVRNKIIACRPVEYNMRIYSQQSVFTIHNTTKKLIDLNNDDMLSRLIIPANSVKKIHHELKICGITLENIYPDEAHIAKNLKRRHM